MNAKPDIPKRLASRIRGAQAKVESARASIEGTEFNAIQKMARWTEFARDPEAFAEKYYPGNAVDSYPVATNTGRIREYLDELPAKRKAQRAELATADAELERTEMEVLAELAVMRPSKGRVPWPPQLPPFEEILKKAIAEGERERDTSDARRTAYLQNLDEEYAAEEARHEAEAAIERGKLAKEMEKWSPQERELYRQVMGAIVGGLRDGSVNLSNVGEFIESRLKGR